MALHSCASAPGFLKSQNSGSWQLRTAIVRRDARRDFARDRRDRIFRGADGAGSPLEPRWSGNIKTRFWQQGPRPSLPFRWFDARLKLQVRPRPCACAKTVFAKKQVELLTDLAVVPRVTTCLKMFHSEVQSVLIGLGTNAQAFVVSLFQLPQYLSVFREGRATLSSWLSPTLVSTQALNHT